MTFLPTIPGQECDTTWKTEYTKEDYLKRDCLFTPDSDSYYLVRRLFVRMSDIVGCGYIGGYQSLLSRFSWELPVFQLFSVFQFYQTIMLLPLGLEDFLQQRYTLNLKIRVCVCVCVQTYIHAFKPSIFLHIPKPLPPLSLLQY